MIKRHLGAEHGLTPEGYRERWGLPRSYPMVAPDYAEVRSGMARQFGLGHRHDGSSGETTPPEQDEAPDTAEPFATADTEPATPSVKGHSRKRTAHSLAARQPGPEAPADAPEDAMLAEEAPDAPVPARGRGQRRAKGSGAE
jgi:hypothetical protein